MNVQMEAHHYCSILNHDIIQCVVYDGNVKDAKMIGVEYVISGKLFATLPAAEKALWHSHVHELTSGQLVAPGIPEVAELELMKKHELTGCAAAQVDRVLKGAKPGDVPMDRVTRFELAANQRTAVTIGAQIPRLMRTLADDVIE